MAMYLLGDLLKHREDTEKKIVCPVSGILASKHEGY